MRISVLLCVFLCLSACSGRETGRRSPCIENGGWTDFEGVSRSGTDPIFGKDNLEEECHYEDL